jgi:RHS repeat-associated protein
LAIVPDVFTRDPLAQGTTVYVNADYEVTGPSQMVAPPSTLPPTYTHKLYLPVVSCAGCNGIPSLNEPLLNLATTRVTYRFNGQQVAVREGVTLTFVYGDHLDSASVTANISGTKVSEVRYYPFGETRYSSGTTSTSKRFTSQEEQIGIGLYDYGARFYDPTIGRFVSADSVVPRPGDPQALNRYAYARNAPLSRLDPSGHDDTIADILDFFKGASMQYSDDVTMGMQSALNTDVKREFETNGNFAFIAGREWGRTANTLQGINESISGGSTMIGGLIAGSGVTVLGCA